MRRYPFAIFAAALVATAACSSTTDNAAPPSSGATSAGASTPGQAASGEPIVIGVAASLTGPLSAYDAPLLKAEQLAVDDVNAKGGVLGRPLKIVTADNKTDLKLVNSAAQQVLDQDAKLLIPTCDYNVGGPAARLANSKGVPSITCAGSTLFGREGVGALAFSSFQSSPTEGAQLAEFAVKKGVKKPYLLVDTSADYPKDACKYFEQSYQHATGSGANGQDTFVNTDTSVAAQVSRFQASGSDALVLCTYLPGGATALKQVRASGYTGPIYTLTTFDGTFWTEAVPNLSNVYFNAVGAITGDDPDPAINDFFKRFEETTGGPPLFSLYMTGYSVVQTFAAAAERAGSTDGAKVAQAIEAFKDEPLIAGPTTYTEACHIPFGRPMRTMQFQNGALSFVEATKASYIPPAPC